MTPEPKEQEKEAPRMPEDTGETVVAEGDEALARMQGISRRALLQLGLMSAGTVAGMWAFTKYAPEDGTGIKQILRNGLQFNEAVAQTVFFSPSNKDREFPRERAIKPRNNYHGQTPEMDPATWRLNLEGSANSPTALTMDDLRDLPEVTQTTELKCVEGWSAVVNWTGIRFADFARKYPPQPGVRYVAMRSEPPGWEDTWYYVGLTLESCLHPQTLLAYARDGKPLEVEHGSPLRLVLPHHYGIKNIKLITHIAYTVERPRDYWADQGYDWYALL